MEQTAVKFRKLSQITEKDLKLWQKCAMIKVTKTEQDLYVRKHKKGASLWKRRLSLLSVVSMEAVELK